MSTGADPKTMPVTREYEDGYERVYGKREPVRGKWIWDEAQQKLVPASEYRPPEARFAPVMVDRFYEGASVPVADEKTGQVTLRDIGSRQKHRAYMKERGLTTIDDFKNEWAQAEKIRREGDPAERKAIREAIGRAAYEVEQRERNAKRR